MEKENSYKLYIVFCDSDYKEIEDFHFGFAAAYHTNGVCGFIDLKGHETLLLEYQNIDSFYGTIAPVCKNNLWGFIDSEFNEKIPCKYLFLIFYKSGFIVKENYEGDFLAIDSYGKVTYADRNIDNVKRHLEKKIPIIELSDSDIKKIEYKILGTNLRNFFYVNFDGKKICEVPNMENRDFSSGYVVIKADKNEFKIFNKKGKKLKIHACIFENDYNNPLVNHLNFRITGREELKNKVKIKG